MYEQGEGASPNTLLETFREADKAVLLGTRSFWEGVDIPGEALSVLVIVKLPFEVPTEPIIAARSETFEDPFTEYQLPEAILRFRQGFGRLIRTQSDRGVVAILDRRILTKRYGRAFLESLPDLQCKDWTDARAARQSRQMAQPLTIAGVNPHPPATFRWVFSLLQNFHVPRLQPENRWPRGKVIIRRHAELVGAGDRNEQQVTPMGFW